jgi:hypothetical protein
MAAIFMSLPARRRGATQDLTEQAGSEAVEIEHRREGPVLSMTIWE